MSRRFVPRHKIMRSLADLLGAKGVSLGDTGPMDTLTRKFYVAALKHPGKIRQVEAYGLDWDNEENNGFIDNAERLAVKCLLADSGSTDFTFENGVWQFAGISMNPDFTNRVIQAIDYAQEWIAKQPETYGAPRLIEIPSLYKTIVWIPGARNEFIVASVFGTKSSDPLSIEKDFLNDLRKELAAQRKSWGGKPGIGG